MKKILIALSLLIAVTSAASSWGGYLSLIDVQFMNCTGKAITVFYDGYKYNFDGDAHNHYPKSVGYFTLSGNTNSPTSLEKILSIYTNLYYDRQVDIIFSGGLISKLNLASVKTGGYLAVKPTLGNGVTVFPRRSVIWPVEKGFSAGAMTVKLGCKFKK